MEERRQDDVKIDVITERLNNLLQTVAEEKEVSLEWRNRFCKKLDVAISKIDSLPCGARIEITKALRSDVTWLQRIGSWALALIISSLFTLGVSWGAINTQVIKDSEKLHEVSSHQMTVLKDIMILKEFINQDTELK